MKYNEETFKKEIQNLYNGELEIVSRYKNQVSPILVKDKYGVMQVKTARQLLNHRPNIKSALNKEEYFMNMLKEVHPEIAELVTPASKYETMKTKMLFDTKYGLISVNPDALLHGHKPSVRGAVNRKDYMKKQLLFLYDNKYDFIIDSTDRHKGRITLICPIHGPQSIDSDTVFTGCGCPQCNHGWEKSNLFYLIRLYDSEESFYKLGISHKLENGDIRRFKEYRALNYNIEVIKIIEFEDFLETRELETSLKRIIRPNLYTPKRWDSETSTECFTDSLLPTILNRINYDIVSTSSENQSCNNGQEVTNPTEDI